MRGYRRKKEALRRFNLNPETEKAKLGFVESLLISRYKDPKYRVEAVLPECNLKVKLYRGIDVKTTIYPHYDTKIFTFPGECKVTIPPSIIESWKPYIKIVVQKSPDNVTVDRVIEDFYEFMAEKDVLEIQNKAWLARFNELLDVLHDTPLDSPIHEEWKEMLAHQRETEVNLRDFIVECVAVKKETNDLLIVSMAKVDKHVQEYFSCHIAAEDQALELIKTIRKILPCQ